MLPRRGKANMDDQYLIGDSEESEKDAAPFKPANLVGRELDGRYELKKCIGRGGMGVVYLAHQRALSRDVVVKLLPPNFADDADALARFQREARGMSKLQHPHIVSVYDFGIEDGQAYIVMEYVEGVTLRRFVREHQGPERMHFETFGTIALQIIEGLGAAHALGLVHRDIKPSNIMLSERGNTPYYVKILDFGLAKLVRGAQDITRDQGLVGSVGYLSPEQILGHENDERVDIYALGVLFYYMLAGQKPFVGDDDVAVLYQHVHQAPRPLEELVSPQQQVPPAALALIQRMLAKSPDARPANAAALLRDFSECLEGSSVRSPHVSGEFRAVSRSGEYRVGVHPDPSAELDSERVRQQTPFSPASPSSTPTLSGLYAMGSDSFPSASGSWVSGEHLLKVERQNRTRNILLGIVALLILGVAMALLLQNQRPQRPAPVGAAQPPAELAPPAVSEVEPPAPPPVEAPVMARPALGRLEVSARPKASVFLDNQALGETPIAREIEVGAHQLEVRKKGWQTIHREVHVDAQRPLRFAFEMERSKKTPPPAAPRPVAKPAANPAPRPTAADAPLPVEPHQPGDDDLLPAIIPQDNDDLLMP